MEKCLTLVLIIFASIFYQIAGQIEESLLLQYLRGVLSRWAASQDSQSQILLPASIKYMGYYFLYDIFHFMYRFHPWLFIIFLILFYTLL